MTQAPQVLIYGAYGYTGELLTRGAAARGLPAILAGRDRGRLDALARQHGLEARVVGLDDPRALDAALDGVTVVAHAAGPFVRTARPMVEACLRTRTHYLDITGELDVFEALFARDAEARSAGVMLLPGAGFDVVPSDCLAAHLARRLPSATHLALAFKGLSKTSRGTALTTIEHLGLGGRVRRDGVIVTVPLGSLVRRIDFGRGPQLAAAIPWGDVSTAFHSTGIPNIEVYLPAPRPLLMGMRAIGAAPALVGSRPARRLLSWLVKMGPAGPSDEDRAQGGATLWGEATNATGERVTARLTTTDGYTLTRDAVLAIAERVLAGEVRPGFQTPSRAYGADFVLTLPGAAREDLDG